MKVKFIQDMDKAIEVMRMASKWMSESGLEVSKWWKMENLNREFLSKHSKSNQYWVLLVDDVPAASAVLQMDQGWEDWREIDAGKPPKALYIHWVAVNREYAGQGLVKEIVEFAAKLAKEKGISILRLDTGADNSKLRKVYEDVGFELVDELQSDYRKSAFYQKRFE